MAFDWKAEKQWHKWSLAGGLQYNLTKSTVETTSDGDLEKVGKQLIYVPLHTGKVNLEVEFSNWTLVYFHNLTAKRFSDPLNNTEVDGFQTGDVNLTWARPIGAKQQTIQIGLEVRNVWNATYEVVAYYPMPSRAIYVQAGFLF